MHALHEYLTDRLQEMLQKRRVVVWYDTNEEFGPYLDELPEAEVEGGIPAVRIGDLGVRLVRFEGSFFAIRAAVEPLVSVDLPDPLLIYIPGVTRDRTGSVLMELEKAGECYEPQLKRHARTVLRQLRTDGVIDEMLAPERLSYGDVVSLLSQIEGEERASLLRAAFPECRENTTLLAQWLADDSRDHDLTSKQAVPELAKLIESRLGMPVEADGALPAARARTARYVLVNEFRADLAGDPPSSVALIPTPPGAEHLNVVREVASKMRADHGDAYVGLADQIEAELNLANSGIDAANLGSTDTFRFEERLLLKRADELIAARDHTGALEVVEGRGRSFWVDREIARRSQWEACRLMAQLGAHVDGVGPAVGDMGDDPAAWVEAYTGKDGWYQADLTHRTLESWITKMEDEPEAERALAVVRREYEELLKRMTEGFSRALQHSGWTVPGVLPQTAIYPELVEPQRTPTAYFLVDAMRFEMGVELARQLGEAEDLMVRPAVAALPTVTAVGMAALLPDASASFTVVEHRDNLTARIADSCMPALPARQKHLKAAAPDSVEMPIGKLLQTSSGRLRKTIEGAPLVVVRSQEIDALGEGGDDWLARQTMDSVVGNVARGVRKLAGLGIANFVIVADHGYQFSLRKEEDMRTDSPGGDTVEIHRRCWAGRGGQTPPGAVRVTGADLGYDTDLDFIFPTGLGVFKTPGGLSYHHGGCSLQELVIPVISLRFVAEAEEQPSAEIILSDYPATIVNRTFGVVITVQAGLFSEGPVALRPLILCGGEQAGEAGMAHPEECFDRSTKCLHVEPGATVSVGMMLTKDDCTTVRIAIQDPATDAVLAQSDEIPVKLVI